MSTRRHGRRTPRVLRILAAAAAAIALVSGAAACGSSDTETTSDGKTVLRYQGWASEVTYPELAENLGFFQTVSLKWVGDTTSGPQDIQSAATGQTEYGGAFNGAITKLAAANSPIKAVVGYYAPTRRPTPANTCWTVARSRAPATSSARRSA